MAEQEVPQQPMLDEEEEELGFNLIDELQSVGIGLVNLLTC